MKKSFIVIFCITLFLSFLFIGCSNENNTPNQDITSEPLDSIQPYREDLAELEILYNLVTLITDRSLFSYENDFFKIAIDSVLTNSEQTLSSMLELQQTISDITMPIIMNSIPQGYALQEAWSNLQSKCSLINSLIESTVNAVYDGDSYTVLENKDTIGNLDVLEIAIYVENTLSKEIANLKNLIKNESIEIKFSYDECKEIARRYAEYYFENIEIGVITGETTPVVFKDINGKHYVFSVEGIENVNILISVEDKSIIRQEHLDTGFRYAYEDINVLPATDEETAMPNLIGMELSQATAVLDSMGISYEIGWIDFEDVEYGCVAHQYPSAGKVVFDDTVVNLLLAK